MRIMGTRGVPLLVIPGWVVSSLACANATTPSSQSAAPKVTWVQVWSDEFDGPAGGRIDTTKWNYQIGDGCDQGNCGWGNQEKEYYSDAAENIPLNGQG